VGFVVNKVALEEVLLPVLLFSPVRITEPVLCTHSFVTNTIHIYYQQLTALSYSTQTHCAFTCSASYTVTVCVCVCVSLVFPLPLTNPTNKHISCCMFRTAILL